MEEVERRGELGSLAAEPLSPSRNLNQRGFGSPEQIASPEFGGFFRQTSKVRRYLDLKS